MELACTIILNNIQEDVLNFSPNTINSTLELLRMDIGSDKNTINSVLDITQILVKTPKFSYIDEEGNIKKMEEKEYTDILAEMLEVIDSLFVEPNKTYY